MDVHTKEQRSRNMSGIRGKNTKPELIVRKIVHRLGYRYRLHSRELPGAPDIVLTRLMKIVNVHGCFWHMHTCRYGCVTPKTNAAFWEAKRNGNTKRDIRNLRGLRKAGWKVLTIWECQTKDVDKLTARLSRFLSD